MSTNKSEYSDIILPVDEGREVLIFEKVNPMIGYVFSVTFPEELYNKFLSPYGLKNYEIIYKDWNLCPKPVFNYFAGYLTIDLQTLMCYYTDVVYKMYASIASCAPYTYGKPFFFNTTDIDVAWFDRKYYTDNLFAIHHSWYCYIRPFVVGVDLTRLFTAEEITVKLFYCMKWEYVGYPRFAECIDVEEEDIPVKTLTQLMLSFGSSIIPIAVPRRRRGVHKACILPITLVSFYEYGVKHDVLLFIEDSADLWYMESCIKWAPNVQYDPKICDYRNIIVRVTALENGYVRIEHIAGCCKFSHLCIVGVKGLDDLYKKYEEYVKNEGCTKKLNNGKQYIYAKCSNSQFFYNHGDKIWIPYKCKYENPPPPVVYVYVGEVKWFESK